MNTTILNFDPQSQDQTELSGFDAGRELYRINVDENGEHVSTTFFIYTTKEIKVLTFMRRTGRLVRACS